MPGENQPSCGEGAACTYLSQPAPASAHALRQSAHQPASAWRRPYPRRHRTPCAAATAAAAPLPPIGLCCREVCAPRTRRSRRASRLQPRPRRRGRAAARAARRPRPVGRPDRGLGSCRRSGAAATPRRRKTRPAAAEIRPDQSPIGRRVPRSPTRPASHSAHPPAPTTTRAPRGRTVGAGRSKPEQTAAS